MFTNSKRQLERTGKYGTSREDHLQTLVTQFQEPSQSMKTKEKLVSNLANFAYDPYNYTFLRNLNVLELFIDCLSEPNEPRLTEFAAAGICNAAADPDNARVIVASGGVEALLDCLSAPLGISSTVNYAIAGLFYLCESDCNVAELINKAEVVTMVKTVADGGVLFQNVARVLLDKHLSEIRNT